MRNMRRSDRDATAEARTRRRRPATIGDVARLAGVAPSTVSFVLNNHKAVSEKTREHVLGVMKILDYHPNRMARNLRSGLSAAAGLIIPDMDNPFFSMIAQGAQTAAQEADVLMVLCTTGAKLALEEYYARVVEARRLDGLLYVSGSGIPSKPLLGLVTAGHVVFVDEQLPGIKVDAVVGTNRQGARDIASYVMEQGHSRVAIVSGPRALWTSEERLAGFREAIAAAGLDPDETVVYPGDYIEAGGGAAAAAIFALPFRKRPTAVLCSNDMMAFGFMKAARKSSIAIPEQISVTGFDDVPAASLTEPPLTTVALPAYEMGHRGMQMLLANLGAPRDFPLIEERPTSLVIRASVAQLKKSEGFREVRAVGLRQSDKLPRA